MNAKSKIEEVYNVIEEALLTHKEIAVLVTFNVEESEYEGTYTAPSSTKHVGSVVSATLQEEFPTKRLLLFIAGRPEPLEISGVTKVDISIRVKN